MLFAHVSSLVAQSPLKSRPLDDIDLVRIATLSDPKWRTSLQADAMTGTCLILFRRSCLHSLAVIGGDDELYEVDWEGDDAEPWDGGGPREEDSADGQPQDDEDDEDGSTGADEGASGNGAADTQTGKTRLRPTLPLWLSADYNNVCERLRCEMARNPSGKPSCYDSGQFLFVPRAPVFLAQKIAQLHPALFYLPQYFVWLPHLLIHPRRIPCPACKAANRKNKDGHPVLLRCLSFPRAPRRIIDIEDNKYIIGYRYYCAHGDCKKVYPSWSPSLLSVLPQSVTAEFTFLLSYRNGITDRLAGLLRTSFQRGLGPSPFVKMIRSFHQRRYERLMAQFLEMVKVRLPLVNTSFLALHTEFSDWADLSGYAGFVPTQAYFRDVYNALIEKHAAEMDQYSAMLPATIICMDHSHKVRN